ncbi:MAG: glycosyltransferase family 39 protein, partial [Candidatus Mariimomonas ferrooxydans]
MADNPSSHNKTGCILIVSMLTLSVFLTQFMFRNLDDNRLTRWSWAFSDVNIINIFAILVLGVIIAYAFSKVSFPERYPGIFLFLSSFVIGALFWEEPEVIVDTSRYFTQAKHLEMYGIKYFIEEWGRNIDVWTDLPLVPFLYGLIFKFFGEYRTYIQIFTTSLFSMTAVLIYLTGRTLWDKNAGFFAGLLFLGIPYIFSQVPTMLIDVPVMFFLMLSLFTFIRAMEKGGVWIAISSVAIFFAFFSKYSTWLMLSVLVVIFLVYLKVPPTLTLPLEGGGQGRGCKKRVIFSRGCSIALIAGFFIGIVILYKFDVISGQIRFLLEYQRPGLKRWSESFVSTFLFQVHPFITVSALFSAFIAFRKKDLRYLIIVWLMFLLVAVFQIRRIRYLLITFPMVALMASYALQEIKTMELRRFIALCIVASSLVLAIFVYRPFLLKMSPVNLKNAGQYLNSLEIKNIEVFTLPQKRSVVNPAAPHYLNHHS